MNRTTLPLSTLLLAASLASCAPTVQGPMGGYRPNVVTGVAYTLATKIPVAQIAEATPDATYATFDDCARVAVSVGDVKKLGVEAADQVCRDTEKNLNAALSSLSVIGAIVTIPLLYFVYVLFSLFYKAIGS